MLCKVLTTVAGLFSIGFGLWHFFIPKIWQWYSRIDARASELALAVMITNLFFSLSLVLMGLVNIILAWDSQTSNSTMLVVNSASAVLWITRVLVQLRRPQGSFDLRMQYGMLIIFVLVASMYVVSAVLVANKNYQ